MHASIGAFEAKAQLFRLLRAVEQGERFTISVRGKPVADLIPHRANAVEASVSPAPDSVVIDASMALTWLFAPHQPGEHEHAQGIETGFDHRQKPLNC